MNRLPVLLISGWAHGAEAMSPLTEAVRDSYRIVSLSLASPGIRSGEMQGAEADAAGPQDAATPISAYAKAVVRHLEEIDEPSCIIGWSTGGIAAIEAAARCPRKVAGLVLLGTTARFCAETPAIAPGTKDYGKRRANIPAQRTPAQTIPRKYIARV